MDITDIKRRLADNAESVSAHLLPNGRRDGSEWKCGSVNGEAGKSLGVVLKGPKAGTWCDFSSPDDSGDLLDLWCAVKRITLTEALAEAKSWLGVSEPELHRPKPRQYTRPPKPAGIKAPEGRVRDYLTEERNIPAEVIKRYRVAEAGGEIVFPFLLPDGELAMAKVRAAYDGGKTKPTAADCEPVLFGWHAVPEGARSVVITEGEIDALSWAAYGYPAMSVPFGGGKGAKQQWIENDFDRLARFERIYISTDMDGPGDEAAAEIIPRLGRHRCFRVSLPRKDANECLVDGIPQQVMDEAIKTAKSSDPEGLKKASEYADTVVGLFWPTPGQHVGYTTPYGKLHDKLHFRPGEVTIWSGDTGHGKSQILSDCEPHWIKEGSRLCKSSLEMKPAYSLKRSVKQVLDTDRPTEHAIRAALDWLDGGLWLYDQVGKAKVEQLLEIFDYARARYGCDQFIIDSLMRMGVAGDDYNTQEAVIYRLVNWAVENSVHVHIVCHAKKGAKDRGVPESDDIKGAMEIGGNAANIITIWRNRKLEDQIAAARVAQEQGRQSAEATPLSELEQKPGVILNVAKQRNGDWEGKIGLWFDQESYRYQSSYDRQMWSARKYLPEGWNAVETHKEVAE
jgi:twinkle protein